MSSLFSKLHFSNKQTAIINWISIIILLILLGTILSAILGTFINKTTITEEVIYKGHARSYTGSKIGIPFQFLIDMDTEACSGCKEITVLLRPWIGNLLIFFAIISPLMLLKSFKKIIKSKYTFFFTSILIILILVLFSYLFDKNDFFKIELF